MKRFIGFIAVVLLMSAGVFAQSGKYGFISQCANGLYSVSSKEGNTMGVIDVTGRVIVPLKYEYVNVINDSTIVVSLDGRTGIIDLKGNVVLPFKYDTLWDYGSRYFVANQNQVIDRDGNVLFTAAPGEEVRECNRDYVVVSKGEKYGVKTFDGRQVVPTVYDAVELPNEGLLPVMKDGKLGFADLNGSLVIPMIYEHHSGEEEDNNADTVYGFREGLASVSNGEMFGYIDVNGNIVIPFKYTWADAFKNGKAVVNTVDAAGNYDEFKIDKTGNRLSEPAYVDEQGLKEGIALFADQNTWKWGYKNPKTGKVIIPAKYTTASPFYNGYALVRIGDGICIIDKTGRVVLRNIADYSYFDAA